MWFIGLLLGVLVGATVGGGSGAFALGILGAVAGAAWSRLNRDAGKAGSGDPAHPAEQARDHRIAALEARVNAMQKELGALRAVVDGRATQGVDAAADRAAAAGSPAASRFDGVAESAELAEFDLTLPPSQPQPNPNTNPFSAALAESTALAAQSAAIADVADVPSSAAVESAPPSLWSRILDANPLAKIGVILLFFGVASALRLAVEYGLLPVPVRLILAAVAGLGLIAFGFRRVGTAAEGNPAHRHFGLAIQGGGFALLYLVVHFMLARYALLGQGPAFGLFAALGLACVLLAARQDGPMLAVFGLSGAFLAPVLAGGSSQTPVPLFTYLALINAFILAVDWFRSWRVLNIAGFLFTVAVGSLWAMHGYREEHYLAVQCFLILFVVAYSAMPVATLLFRAPGSEAWREGILVFGVPLAGVALQSRLVDNVDYAQAWSAAIAGIYYLGLWGLLFRRADLEMKFFERAHLGIAIAFFTLAIPLAFDAQVTSAFWAAEGCAVLWFGAVRGRTLAQAVGLLMQLAAGISFVFGADEMSRVRPVLNDFVIGGAILAIAGLLCGRLLQRRAGTSGPQGGTLSDRLLRIDTVPAELPAVWGLLWWFGSGFAEIDHFAPRLLEAPLGLVFAGASVAVLEVLGMRWGWALLRHVAVVLLPLMALAALMSIDRGQHPLAGAMLFALPLVLAEHYLLLRRHEQARLADALPKVLVGEARHLGAWWLAVFVAGWELAWLAEQAAPRVTLWPLLAWGLAGIAALAFSRFALQRGLWPWSALPALYRGPGNLPVVLALGGWIVVTVGTHAGGGTGLPWVPVLNPQDLAVLGALWAIFHAIENPQRNLAVGGLGFLWLTTLAGRIAHHWGGVSWNAHLLWNSTLAQALVTVFWTLAAIAAMILATRIGARRLWMGGMGLLGIVGAKLLLVDLANSGTITWTASLIGVALLLLAAGYFAPAPPAGPAATGRSGA